VLSHCEAPQTGLISSSATVSALIPQGSTAAWEPWPKGRPSHRPKSLGPWLPAKRSPGAGCPTRGAKHCVEVVGFAGEALRSAAAVLERATAAPWRASASRRRPPLWGRSWEVAGRATLPRLRWLGAQVRCVARVLARACSRGCAADRHLGLDLLPFFLAHLRWPRIAHTCPDPLQHSRFACLIVHLYCYNKGCAKGPKPIACGHPIP